MAPQPSGASPKVLNDYQLGDCLGKGAFGQVYRALNWATGETVAVKEIQLANIPKSELGEIMSEIDLLKNLNHPNIVKYKGFVKTREYLYIILEFCENGSLHAICKRFGKFPENLVAVYISQVLEGLVYLHDQGVIHRDIKGANLLTNKDGTVKLADFGVASTAAGANDAAVVGSPYWMAPEVIEQSGATTSSDIWSVGCTVIELLEGKPPYHGLDPMPALFRIVQDDCPPIPEGASPIVKDFLYHCFQKDCNLRISAKKLLKHPWMAQARRQMAPQLQVGEHNGSRSSNGDESKTKERTTAASAEPAKERPQTENAQGRRPLSNYNYDEAVARVQEWNEALKSPSKPAKHPHRNRGLSVPEAPPSPIHGTINAGIPASTSSSSSGSSQPTLLASSVLWAGKPHAQMPVLGGAPLLGAGPLLGAAPRLTEKIRDPAPLALQVPEEQTDNWDDDFEEGISLSKIHALEKTSADEEKPVEVDENSRTIRPTKSPGAPVAKLPAPGIGTIEEDWSELVDDDAGTLESKVADFKMKHSFRKGLFHPDDIKTVGLGNVAPGPSTAPLPNMKSSVTRKPSRPGLAPLKSSSPLAGPSSARSSSSPHGQLPMERHARSSSFVGSAGSVGRQAELGEFEKYAEADDDDYEDVFGKVNGTSAEHPLQTLQLNTRHSNKSWLGDEDGDDDPFAEIDEGFDEDDLETNLQRDKYARLCNSVNQLIDELTPAAADFQLREACDQLWNILTETPEMQGQLVSAHGMLAILEVLEGRLHRDVSVKLLQIVNLLVTEDIGFLESFCLIGGIPVIMGFTSKKHPSECRLEASNFIRLLCHTSPMTLQMFIACRGLRVLVDLLDEDYGEQGALVVHALNGIGSVFDLQSPTTKNDFCRMFIREGLLDPLSSALLNVMATHGDSSAEMKMKIIQILVVFCQVSQSDIHVRNALGTRKVIRRLLRACELLEPEYLVQMLKALKHLSMNATLLDVLQNANAIEIEVKILDEQSTGPNSTEISNHIFQTLYNLCRLNKSRQEEAAQAGIIPSLKRIIESRSPLKQFALPILCDLAGAGKSCRTLLWHHNGLSLYLQLLADPYFQVSALESILSWLQDETARVEDELVKTESLEALLTCFVSAKTNSFENLLEPFLKLLRMSSSIAIGVARSRFFNRTIDKLSHPKAVVRLALLRILRAVCEVHPNRVALVDRFGLYSLVGRLSKDDQAVMVRELAREMRPTLAPGLRPAASALRSASGDSKNGSSGVAPKKGRMRRTASEASALGQSPPATPLSAVPNLPSNGSRPAPAYGSGTSRPAVKARPRHRLGDIPWASESQERQ